MSSNPEQTFDEAPSDFLHSLVDAMRRVVEATRDRTLAEMREAVETEAGQLDLARAAREAALRERAEGEITGVGSWERAEIERIRSEALRKVQARGGQLDQELAELAAANTADHAALAARADAYEREVSAFIQGLDGIQDPAAFAAAARSMPSPWAVKAPPTVARPPLARPSLAAPRVPFVLNPVEDRPAEPDDEPVAEAPMPEAPATPEPMVAEAPVEVPVAEAPIPEAPATPEPMIAEAPVAEPPVAEPPVAEAPVAEPVAEAPVAEPVAEAPTPAAEPEAAQPEPAMPEPAAPAQPEPMVAEAVEIPADVAHSNGVTSATDASAADVVPAEPVAAESGPDQATSIQVHGLGSFGAITSFKQSLEKVDGIRSVTLGLGPSGEFVYTATHAPAFDLGGAIRAIEGDGVQIERDNGTLRVKVGKAAKAG